MLEAYVNCLMENWRKFFVFYAIACFVSLLTNGNVTLLALAETICAYCIIIPVRDKCMTNYSELIAFNAFTAVILFAPALINPWWLSFSLLYLILMIVLSFPQVFIIYSLKRMNDKK